MRKLSLLIIFSFIFCTLSAQPLIVKTKYLKSCNTDTDECTEYVSRDVFFEFDPVDSKTIVITGDGPSAITCKVIDFKVEKGENGIVTTQFTCANSIFIVYTSKLDIDYHSIVFSVLKSNTILVYDNKI